MKEGNCLSSMLCRAGMAGIAFVCMLLCGSAVARAEKAMAIQNDTTTVDDKIYETVDENPEFSGGVQGLMSWLGENLQYPKAAQMNGVEGRVLVSFVIGKDGNVDKAHTQVVRPVNPALDREAIRVINAMPRWKPGMQKGEAVRVKVTTPITFRLSDPKKKK